MSRRSGVLMSISSLPSKYGIGVFGKDAVDFAAKIKKMGFSCWQVLPFTPVDYANSPYGSDSAFAGNELYINPELLIRDGYITEAEAKGSEYGGSPFTADYAFAKQKRHELLRSAFSRIDRREKERVSEFIKEQDLLHHCLYRALNKKNGGVPFWEWKVGRIYSDALKLTDELEDEVLFAGFVQYIFRRQWTEIKEQINDIGVSIIGDIPIYVSRDSADVWAHPELFMLDEKDGAPSLVAGVPPDYFSEDGQLWGNPLYDWDAQEKDGYGWWIKRIRSSLCLYDELRIDHFRAFASFYAVKGDAANAKEGIWMKGPGMKLFDRVAKAIPDARIIAEDLGVFGKDVVQLLEDSGFPGMKIIQFGFTPDEDSAHLPHNYPKNCVAYIGTHDNNTLLGWLWEATHEERAFALDYCGFDGDNWGDGGYHAPACHKIIETVWRSNADTVIIPFQDMCGFGSDARMNVPGDDSGKWQFRTTKETIDSINSDYFEKINRTFRR